MTAKETERLAVVETNITNLDKKVDTGFADLRADVKALTATVQQLTTNFVTHPQLTEKTADLEKEIVTLKQEVINAKRKNSYQVWITSTLTAGFAIVLTILIQNYFK